MLTDPFVSMSARLEVRGDTPGFLFCNIVGDGEMQRICHHQPWQNRKFVEFMRSRFISLGMAPGEAKLFTGYSLKRGCVQLLRNLGVQDEEVMRWIKMDGVKAYLDHTEAFDNSAPPSIPAFSNLEAMESHMRACNRLKSIRGGEGMFDFIDGWIAAEVTNKE